jgi:hypothetical protein
MKITKAERKLILRAVDVAVTSGAFFFTMEETEKLREIKKKIRDSKKKGGKVA